MTMTGITTSGDHASLLLNEQERNRESRNGACVAALKLRVRQSDAPGYLPVCWGIWAGVLGLDVGVLEKLFDSSSSGMPNPLLYAPRPWCLSTPLSPRAARALRGGAHEYFGSLRRTAAPTRSQASAL
jgi:Zn-finger nucleic acid-binding protein